MKKPRRSSNPTSEKRTVSYFLVGFALLVLLVVVLRRFLEPHVGSLSGVAKWCSQALIVGTAIYALFVPPYDKERRRLSRAGFVTIFSLLIAFGAFALSDWKDRVGAKLADDQRKDQIRRLQDINDVQKTTLNIQSEALAGIKIVSAQQAETSLKLTEQAKAQDQLVKDAQNLLKGQSVQLQRQEETIRGQARTLTELGRAQQLLGTFEVFPEIYIRKDNQILKAWVDRVEDTLHMSLESVPFVHRMQLEQILRNPKLRPDHNNPSERSAAELLVRESLHGIVDGVTDFRFYRKGKAPNFASLKKLIEAEDLRFMITGTAELFVFDTRLTMPGGGEQRVLGLFGTIKSDPNPKLLTQGDKMISLQDFSDATVVAFLMVNQEAEMFQLAEVVIRSSQGRTLKIEGFVPVVGRKGWFLAKIPTHADWR